jgi:hypothetical protein
LVLPTLTILKSTSGVTDTFGWTVTGANPLTPSASVPANSTNFSVFSASINVGSSIISENAPPAGWTLTDAVCTGASLGVTNGTPDNNGVPTSITFNATYGDHVVCSYVNSNVQTTRTQGFWSTHTALANNVWNGTGTLPGETALGTDNTLCGVTITAQALPGLNELMGGFWSNVSKVSTNGKRTPIDQARMQMLQQYLAAVLNVHAFGSGSEGMLATAQAAYCGNDQSAIKAQVGILGTFNQSGDNQTFTPGASATAQESKKEADIPFWNTPSTPHN